MPAADLANEMLRASLPSFGFFFMLALAAAIATFGLIANSSPTIIGAMIIAPLMSPILGLAFGCASFERRLITLSIVTIVLGVGLVIAIAFLSTLTLGMRVTGSEVLSRTQPTLLDLGVALASGGAAAFAHTRRSIANSIAGVAIAVALVPPLAVCGIGLALGGKAIGAAGESLSEFGLWGGGSDIATGAFILFLTNFVGIIVVAMLVFVAQSYGTWLRSLAVLAVFVVISTALVQPLHQALRELYVKNRVLRLVVKLAASRPDLITGQGRLESMNAQYRDGRLHVSLVAFVPKSYASNVEERMHSFRKIISADVGEPIVLEIDAVPVEVIHVRSPPSPAAPSSDGTKAPPQGNK